VGDSYEPRG